MITREDIRELAAFQSNGDGCALSFYFQPRTPQNRSHKEEAILAKDLVRQATIAKQAADLHTASLAQRAVATLLTRFDYDGHLATIRKVYGERCDAMLRALERHLPAGTRWTRPAGGLFVWGQFPRGLDAEEIFAAAVKEKVAFVPGSVFYADNPPRDFFRLNYSNRPSDLIDEGIARIGRVVNERLD